MHLRVNKSRGSQVYNATANRARISAAATVAAAEAAAADITSLSRCEPGLGLCSLTDKEFRVV